MKRIHIAFLAALVWVSTAVAASAADFKLADPFVDGCVLAKDKPVRVYGKGEGRVMVKVAGHKASAKAVDGEWMVELPAMKAGGPYEMTVSSKGQKQVVEDVYIGRVILLGGQSNLQFKLDASNTPKEDWITDPLLRSYSLTRLEKNGEPYSPADGWVRCTKENAGNWSAIGYLTAKKLRELTGEAVAVINCYQGASCIETWIPAEIALQDKYQVPANLRQGDYYEPYYQTWNKPGTLYEATLGEIIPYAVSDIIWYQGESNTGKGEVEIYQALFGELLKSWRNAFKDPTLPFIVIQLADFKFRNDENWKRMQEVQAGLPSAFDNVWSVRSSDVCESDDIHPKSKAALSERIAKMILSKPSTRN